MTLYKKRLAGNCIVLLFFVPFRVDFVCSQSLAVGDRLQRTTRAICSGLSAICACGRDADQHDAMEWEGALFSHECPG